MRYVVQFILYVIFVGFSVRFNALSHPLAGGLCIVLSIPWLRSYSFSRKEIKVLAYALIFGIGTGLFSTFNSEDTGFRYASYIVFFLIPAGVSLMAVAPKSGLKESIVILSVVLVSVFFLGVIEDNRYQQIGNQVAYSGVTLGGFYIGLSLIILLYIGSRQSLLAMIVVFTFSLFRNATIKWRYFLIVFCTIILLNVQKLLLLLENSILGKSRTILRILTKMSSEGGEERLDIWKNTIDRIELFPIGHDYIYENSNLPHNLFLELLHVFGYIIGGILVIPLLRFLFKQVYLDGNSLLLAALIPALLSNGPAAYKYLFLFALLNNGNEYLHPKLS